MEVALAVRISMSIPLFFTAAKGIFVEKRNWDDAVAPIADAIRLEENGVLGQASDSFLRKERKHEIL